VKKRKNVAPKDVVREEKDPVKGVEHQKKVKRRPARREKNSPNPPDHSMSEKKTLPLLKKKKIEMDDER